jgi:hypothetical protein
MKEIIIVTLISIMLVLGACSCTPDEPVDVGGQPVGVDYNPTDDLEITNTFHYVTGIDYYHITGAITNIGDKPLKHVRAVVKAYNSEGVEEVWDDVVVGPSRLAPGETAIFDESMGESDEYDIGNYEILPGYAMVDEEDKYTDLETIITKVDDGGGFYTVYAEVTNIGEEQSPKYWATCQFFDANSNVLRIGTGVVDGEEGGLMPDEIAYLRFTTYHPNSATIITNQEVFVDYS